MRNLAKHLPHYLTLFGILLAGFAGFLLFSFDRGFQAIVAVSLAVAYVAWGIVHHAIHKDLYLSVVLEYVAVASLGLVIIFSLILRT